MPTSMQEQYFRAQSVSPGIATARLCHVASEIGEIKASKNQAPTTYLQWQRLLDAARAQIKRQMKGHTFDQEETSIFEMHLQLLKDEGLQNQVESYLGEGQTLAQALENTLEAWRKEFGTLTNALFRDRLLDLQDVVLRLYRLASKNKVQLTWPDEVCVYSKLALPSCIMHVPSHNLKALVCSEISSASHLAMLARSRKIPCLSKISLPDHLHHAPVIIDGYEGWLIVHPTANTLKRYQKKVMEQSSLQPKRLEEMGASKNEEGKSSSFAVQARIWANIDSWKDVQNLPQEGYEGIGLVRTEYLAYEQGQLPSLRSQVEFYKRIVRHQKGRNVTFRLFDFGSDKPFMQKTKPMEANPALGCRGIRFLLKEPMILKDQLNALLQASCEGSLSILVPMVCTPSEMQRVHRLLKELTHQMKLSKTPPLGMMVEVPSAALTLDAFNLYADFYSLGTNDLLQYVQAVDRNNQAISELYNPMAPALLSLIQLVVQSAKAQGKALSICGEMATDPACVCVLQRLGIKDFSVHPRFFEELQAVLRSL